MPDAGQPVPKPPRSLLALSLQLLFHLPLRRRWNLLGLLVLMVGGAVAELVSVGSILPFLRIASGGTLPALQQSGLQWLSDHAVPGQGHSLLLVSVLVFAVVVLASTGVRILLVLLSTRFGYGLGAELSLDLYRKTLYQHYPYHVSHNSSEIQSGIQKADSVVMGYINPLIQLILAVFLAAGIFASLLAIDTWSAVAAFLGFAVLYALINLPAKSQLRKNGELISQLRTRQIQAVQEGLGGIRDILLDHGQEVYSRRYQRLQQRLLPALIRNQVIGSMARPVIEAGGLILIGSIALGIMVRNGGIAGALPILGSLALGAQKLLPQMQQIYTSWTYMQGFAPMLEEVLQLLDQTIPEPVDTSGARPLLAGNGVPLIEVRDLQFAYQPDLPLVLNGISMRIPSGARIGVVGSSGGGKSTLIDLLLGLLEPGAGHIQVCGQTLGPAERACWQRSVAHVPQLIYLADASIAENIAFGIEPGEIDVRRLRKAAAMAHIGDFIDSLPQGYDTSVGEQGVRLSGGQRQRIGLARALYKRARFLVLDEATSALDDETEGLVMDAINALGDGITILLIAHRTSTLKNCDRIYELGGGRVVREGSYEDMFENALLRDK